MTHIRFQTVLPPLGPRQEIQKISRPIAFEPRHLTGSDTVNIRFGEKKEKASKADPGCVRAWFIRNFVPGFLKVGVAELAGVNGRRVPRQKELSENKNVSSLILQYIEALEAAKNRVSERNTRITLLHQNSWAMRKIKKRYLPVIHSLIEQGENLDAPGELGKRALQYAHEFQLFDIANHLIRRGASVGSTLDEKMNLASTVMVENQLETLKLLLEHGLPVNGENSSSDTLLILATRLGKQDAVKLLIEKGADLNQGQSNSGYTALTWAASHGQEKIAQLLMANGADPDLKASSGDTALMRAIDTGHSKTAKLLLDAGVNLKTRDKLGITPLLFAIQHGNLQTAKDLLASGASLSEVNYEGEGPFHNVGRGNNLKMTRWLLAQNINIEAPDDDGETPLMHWARKGDLPIMKLLLQKGAKVNARDKGGKTPLMYGVQYPKVLKLLIKHGADIHSRDNEGNTCLMHAANTSLNSVKYLIQKQGMDYRDKNFKGETAYQMARNTYYDDIPSYFEDLEDKALYRQNKVQNHASPDLRMKTLIRAISYKEDEPVLSALPHLLFSKPIRSIHRYCQKFERYMDDNEHEQGWHPNEAELFLFLRHPENLNREIKKTGPITKALTSITRFRERVPDATVKAWSDIGFLTHAFKFWRYDTLYKESSLFCKFGFEAISKDKFGQGFLFNPAHPSNEFTALDPDTRVVFRRGYLLVTHPAHGTLLIRNSSKVFGRDLLLHPAYYRPTGLSLEELKNYEPITDDSLKNILTPELYSSRGNTISLDGTNIEEHVVFSRLKLPVLVNELLKLKTEYRRWKLDTKAFERQQGRKIFTGHQSPGLKHILGFIDYLKDFGNQPLPDLAFTHPDYPPFEPYSFQNRQGTSENRFKITDEHLQELRDFAYGSWSRQKYPNSHWVRFLHQAGVEKRGELVLLAPESAPNHDEKSSFLKNVWGNFKG